MQQPFLDNSSFCQSFLEEQHLMKNARCCSTRVRFIISQMYEKKKKYSFLQINHIFSSSYS